MKQRDLEGEEMMIEMLRGKLGDMVSTGYSNRVYEKRKKRHDKKLRD